MKNTWIKGIKGLMAAALLVAALGGSVGTAGATAADTAPTVKDNLSKYGLVKDVELPVTVTAGGLSYTLEKIMIFDSAAPTLQPLIKKYGYPSLGVAELHKFYKYFIWTKITIENTGKTTIQQRSVSPEDKWFLSFTDGADPKSTRSLMPRLVADQINNTEALYGFVLKPGKKLSTYQAFTYSGTDFDQLKIALVVNGSTAEKYVAFK
ncbi:hypothetical protein M2444_006776 [Paenibacillus sp. PastF-3]|uniref:hypothetical protein n=1 Tax=Paenibacillus sp. PastF-3 TaxID=2940626 RepID=UPI002475AA29|nr:hypothetical protein [Paenibacillus sp. PastF-3]MDH6374912.1 hypothetical protein [Paenibacillus sp. PastF-3]